MSQDYQPDFTEYEKKYGDLLQSIAKAFAECSADGDAVGVMFLLNSIDAIVCKSDDILRETHQRTGTA